jgi:hypothetical protein
MIAPNIGDRLNKEAVHEAKQNFDDEEGKGEYFIIPEYFFIGIFLGLNFIILVHLIYNNKNKFKS